MTDQSTERARELMRSHVGFNDLTDKVPFSMTVDMVARAIRETEADTERRCRAEAPVTGWLVEDEYGQLCIGMECNKIKWVTFTNPDAIRFARKRDAENAITLWKLNGNTREHSWG